MSIAPVRLVEAADSLAKASTPEPFSTSRTSNWVARGGGLPAYVQHIAHDLMEKRGMDESRAIQMAIGIVKRWARGGGNVDANTRAAAAKAVAEWEALKGKTAAKGAGKLKESAGVRSLPFSGELALRQAARARLGAIEETLGLQVLVALLEAESGPMKVKCPKCDRVQAASNKTCENCGHDLSKARGAKFSRMQEAASGAAAFKPELKRVASAPMETARHEVHDAGQHVGTITERPGYDVGRPPRFEARAINGDRIGDAHRSRGDALEAVRKHLEEAPARVAPWRDGKFLVSQPQSYSGKTTMAEYPNEQAARYAAGLPSSASSPEKAAAVDRLGEMARLDAATLRTLAPDEPVLARVLGVARRGPFDLAEAFHPGELRGLHGRWAAGGASVAHRVSRSGPALTRTDVAGKVRSRASAVARAPGAGERDALPKAPKLSEPELAKAVRSGAWSASARRATAELKAGRVADTEHAHRTQLPGGRLGFYSPERTLLHQRIVAALLQGAGEHPGRAEAHFLAGGPATGKSSLLKSGDVGVPKDAVTVNPDVIKTMLPEYQALVAAGDKQASSKVHEESSHIAKLLTNLAVLRQHHLVVDTVGNSGKGSFAQKITRVADGGHRVTVHYANTDVGTAIKRAAARGARTGRVVPEGYLRSSHAAVSARFEDVSKLPVAIRVHDTTGPPRLIASKTARGRLHVHDGGRFRAFIEKASGGAKVAAGA